MKFVDTHSLSSSYWIGALRTAVFAVALLVIGLIVTAVPLRYQMLLNDAYGIGPALAEIGVSLHLFALYFVFWELLFATGSLIVGIVIALRKRDDWFALLVAFSLILFGLLTPLMDGLIRANPVWQLPIIFLRWFCLTALVAVFCLFPNGRFVPHWLRYFLIGWVVYTVTLLIFFPDVMADTAVAINAGTLEDFLRLFSGTVWFAPPVVAQIYRYQRVSTPVERQQTKWVLVGFTVIVCFSFISAIFLATNPALPHEPDAPVVAVLVLGAGYLLTAMLLPLSIAFAIFRYRLWQIDIILNRALVYGGLTVLITAVYILLVGGLGKLAVSMHSNLVALLLATGVVVWGIRPLHHRLQILVDTWLPPSSPTDSTTTKNKLTGPAWLRTAWGFFVLLALVLFVTGLVYQAQNGFLKLPSAEILAAAPLLANPFGNDFFLQNDLYPFVLAGGYFQAAVFVSVGLFLFWRKSGDVMGVLASWLLIAIGLGFTPTIIFLPVREPAWHLPTSLLQAGLFGSAFLFLCLFPNGRFYPYWTRTAAVIWLAYVLLWLPFPQLNPHRATIIWPAIMFGVVIWLGVVAQLWRYRRISSADEKQQTKWVIAGFVVANLGLVGIAFLLSLGTNYSVTLLTTAVLALALMPIFIPLSIGVALLRYRLWQIDIILNRSLVYGGLSLGIVVIYALTVGTLSLLFQAQSNLLISLLATGLIAVFFQPIRDRLQRGANRLIYGDRDDPYKVLSQLGRQLRETAVPGQTLPAITATLCQTLKLPYAAVALHTAEGERQTAAATGQPSTVVEEWQLLYQAELVGWLIVAPRSPQERFTGRERQLLADIASQAGAAAYAERQTIALQRSRERLVLAREEERRRIRRDLHDELGPSLASQTFALDAALDLLETDPQAAAPLLAALKSQNQTLIADIRRLVYALRLPSLDELGLLAALKVHISQLAPENNGLQVKVTAVPDPLPPLPAAVEVAAYRIALEGITNVVRHAQARQANVWLAIAQASLSLTIADDGIGLPPVLRPGVGLASMRERAEELGGTFYAESPAGGGTLVNAILPLLEIKMALPEQLPLVMEILGEAAAWLVARGIEQWPSPPNEHWWRRMERYLANGEVYLAYLSGEAMGVLRLIWEDPYWPTAEANAGYVHSLAIRNRVHGLKMGTVLLTWAMDESRRRGKQVIRLDCAAGNGRLRRYYEELGFRFCGEVRDHDYTAALYEKEI